MDSFRVMTVNRGNKFSILIIECWVSINHSELKLIMCAALYFVWPMERILESLLLSLKKKYHQGHWNKYNLTGALTIFPEVKLLTVFVFRFIHFFLGGELEDFLIGQGEYVTGTTLKTKA